LQAGHPKNRSISSLLVESPFLFLVLAGIALAEDPWESDATESPLCASSVPFGGTGKRSSTFSFDRARKLIAN
jgi:hypothetical protein